jgi:hypothetical protein
MNSPSDGTDTMISLTFALAILIAIIVFYQLNKQ